MLETLHACTYKQESFSREKGGGGEVHEQEIVAQDQEGQTINISSEFELEGPRHPKTPSYY